MKKAILFLSVFFILARVNVFADTCAERVTETTIENGLTVFTLEDYSNPLVRIEVNVRAGFSMQNAQNAGFFKLLSALIQKSSKNKFDSVVCDADCTRFVLTIPPSVIEETFENLSEDIFNPAYSDGLLKQEFATMKREVLQNNNDLSYLINSSIDSRVFSDEPWKHDTGIYPSLFSKLTEDNARTILNDVHENFYIPKSAAIFVSGNINSDETLKLIKSTFGKSYSNKKPKYTSLQVSSSEAKKFVIHDKQFSDELTQIVVQYVSFVKDEAEMTAQILNENNSKFKQDVSGMTELNIIGPDYIDVAAAYKTGCTRLVFQSLMQTEKNTTPASQSIKFLNATKTKSSFTSDEFENAIIKNNYLYKKMISSSSDFMDMLSQYWAINPYENFEVDALPENYKSLISYKMQTQSSAVRKVDVSEAEKKIEAEAPFVFVILSTKQYNKCKKEFESNGFVEVTTKNGSWYTQNLYKNMRSYKELLSEEIKTEKTEIDFSKNFYDANKSSITQGRLPNGVFLCVKENKNTTGVTLVISINGGNLRSPDDYGFEEVMINILTTNILRQIEQKQQKNLIVNDFEIYSEAKIDFSRIVIECDVEDFLPILNSCATALIMDEVMPTDADMIVQGRRTRKRLENGSTVNQLYSAAINRTLPDSDFVKIFETEKEILENTTYEKILQNYPNILDASRFSIVVSGNVNTNTVKNQVGKVFSVLKNQSVADKDNSVSKTSRAKMIFPAGEQEKIKLTHTFLTSKSAKEAGPMPAKLIPTSSFADPILFCMKSPASSSSNFFVFNAVLPYLQNALNEYIAERNGLYNCNVSVAKATPLIPMATLTFSSVEKTSAADNAYITVWNKLKEELSNEETSEKILQKIKDDFVAAEFHDAYTNTGSAILIDNGIHESTAKRGTLYLENYLHVNSITAEQILMVLDIYFDMDNFYRLYSSDSKK